MGVEFDTVDGQIALTLEAAHSRPRIVHAGGDSTGARVEETLAGLVRASGVKLEVNTQVYEIVTTGGAAKGVRIAGRLPGEDKIV
jgi:L-aspartate oxidase